MTNLWVRSEMLPTRWPMALPQRMWIAQETLSLGTLTPTQESRHTKQQNRRSHQTK